jgi:hypothetical protein
MILRIYQVYFARQQMTIFIFPYSADYLDGRRERSAVTAWNCQEIRTMKVNAMFFDRSKRLLHCVSFPPAMS